MFILEDIFFNLAIDNYGLNYRFQAIFILYYICISIVVYLF